MGWSCICRLLLGSDFSAGQISKTKAYQTLSRTFYDHNTRPLLSKLVSELWLAAAVDPAANLSLILSDAPQPSS